MTTDEVALDEEIIEDDEGSGDPPVAAGGQGTASTWHRPSVGRWVLFTAIAIGIVALDQVSKAMVMSALPNAGDYLVILGEWLGIVHGRNSGALFGLLPQSAGAFAIVSFGVVALIVWYHARAGRGIVTTIALGLLLGGAIGNLLDRLNYGAVLDFIDMGIGGWRFFTYNLADAAITTAIIMLIAMAVFPRIAEWGTDA